MKRTNPSTHQACRSLLQKAVRRGDVNLTEKVAWHLHEIKDTEWLKKRTLVITFEECWPLGAKLEFPLKFESVLLTLKNAATVVKMKDAAGLGSLAYEHSTDTSSVLNGDTEDRHILSISKAIREPQRFWDWAIAKCSEDEQKLQFIQVAKKSHQRGGWPWDMAFIQAAAYLAIINGVPQIRPSMQMPMECPVWVALDKHTVQGKHALRKAAEQIQGVTTRQLAWISFYCESALTNESRESYWWTRERLWRLNRFGLDYDKAIRIWQKARLIISDLLREEVIELQKHFGAPAQTQNSLNFAENALIQKNLFLSDIEDSSTPEPKRATSIDSEFQRKHNDSPIQGFLFPPD